MEKINYDLLKISAGQKISAQKIRDLMKEWSPGELRFLIVKVAYCEQVKRNLFEQAASKRRNSKGVLIVVRCVIQNYHIADINTLNDAKIGNEFKFQIEKVKLNDEIRNGIQILKVFGRFVDRKVLNAPAYSKYGFTAGQEIEVNFLKTEPGQMGENVIFKEIACPEDKERSFYVNLHKDKNYSETILKLMSNGPHKIWKAKICIITENFITIEIIGEKPIKDSRPPCKFLGCKAGMNVEVDVISPRDKDNYIKPLSYCNSDQRVLFYVYEEQKKSEFVHQYGILKNAHHKEILYAKILKFFMSDKDTAVALLQIFDAAKKVATA